MFHFEEKRMVRHPPVSLGGFGSIYVYKPKKSNGKEWVVKEVYCTDPEKIENYIQEIVLSSNHNSPFILPTSGFNVARKEEEKWVIRIKMPKMNGSLRDYMTNPKSNPFTLDEVVRLLYRLAYGLKQLQNVKISHRDMKPDNILLDKDNNAWIADFGLGRLVVEETEYSQIGLAGTFGYFPPETNGETKTKKKNLHKIDLWNLGVTMYEVCTFKEHGFKREIDKKPLDQQLQIIFGKISKEYGKKFGQIIAGLLSIDPEQRISFDTVCQLLEDNFSEHLQSTFDALTENIRKSHRKIILDRVLNEERKESKSENFIFDCDKELTVKPKNYFGLNSSIIQDLNKMLSKTLSKPSADSVKGLKLDFSWCESLDDNSLQTIDLKNITKKSIEELKLNFAGCIQITDKGLTFINQDNLKGLEKLESLVLDFSESNITKEGLKHVLDNIRDLPLKKLSIRALGSQIEIELAEAQELANKIRQLRNLQLLRLDIPDILKSVKKDLKESLTDIKDVEIV